MGFFHAIVDFFESIFMRSSPEVQKKQAMKKLESEIHNFVPLICKSGILEPNFGEAIFALYKNTRPLDNLFLNTVSSQDIPRRMRYEGQLMLTGYSREEQEVIDELSFENRKEDVESSYPNSDRAYLHQKSLLERVLKGLNTEEFKKMDADILGLRHLVEFCHFNFTSFVQAFDPNFIPNDFTYSPSYAAVPVAKTINLLEDFYYILAGFTVTSSVANAVIAIAQLKKGNELSDTEKNNYLGNLKKINYVVTKVLPSEKIKAIIRFARQDVNFEPQVGAFNGSPRQDFATMLRERFDADERRIKTEIQDERISEDLRELFVDKNSMQEITGYNQTYNKLLQEETSLSFQWTLPIKILKTFVLQYLPSNIHTLLNDIVIEGFFNNPAFKSSFSQIVYAAIGVESEIQVFEESFGSDQKNSIAVMESYIKDSKKDKDFYKKLEKMVRSINDDAHNVLQRSVTALNSLYKQMGELLADAKKPSCEIIQNLKVLMMSSRNKERTNFLESTYENWKFFFEIMKNYVIINSGDMNHE